MSKIAKNIRYLRELKKLSQEHMADDLGITRARLGAYEEGRNEPPISILIQLSDYFHIAIDALIRGDLKKTDPQALMRVGLNRILFPVIIDQEGNDQIEVIPIKASAGYAKGYADPEYIESLQRMKLPFLPTGKHRAFPIKGDSMPPLREGSYVIARYLESMKEVSDGGTYIVITKDDGIVYKRVYKQKNHVLMLHSDNKIYAPYEVKHEDILEIWEYTCCINTSEYKEEELNLSSIMGMLKSLQVELKSLRQ